MSIPAVAKTTEGYDIDALGVEAEEFSFVELCCRSCYENVSGDSLGDIIG
jgi:hypothetical protein